MSRQLWGVLLVIVGLVGGILAAVADVLRIGILPDQFGALQVIGVILGGALFVVGLVLLGGGSAQPEQPEQPASTRPLAQDDLTRIEGIGPALQTILYAGGITTYKALSEAMPDRLQAVVEAAGFQAPFDPASWPRQAALAAVGDWTALDALQANLTGGR